MGMITLSESKKHQVMLPFSLSFFFFLVFQFYRIKFCFSLAAVLQDILGYSDTTYTFDRVLCSPGELFFLIFFSVFFLYCFFVICVFFLYKCWLTLSFVFVVWDLVLLFNCLFLGILLVYLIRICFIEFSKNHYSTVRNFLLDTLSFEIIILCSRVKMVNPLL